MASEQIETSVPVETTTAAGESAQPAAATEQQTKDGRPKRVRTPPEELFDLTKPIPRVSNQIYFVFMWMWCFFTFLGNHWRTTGSRQRGADDGHAWALNQTIQIDSTDSSHLIFEIQFDFSFNFENLARCTALHHCTAWHGPLFDFFLNFETKTNRALM